MRLVAASEPELRPDARYRRGHVFRMPKRAQPKEALARRTKPRPRRPHDMRFRQQFVEKGITGI